MKRALDLFCGRTGGTTVGLQRAGFHVTGVDSRTCRQYPGDQFIQGDALDVLQDVDFLRSFDLLVGGPPCQLFTRASHLREAQGKSTSKLNLIPQTREGFAAAGRPYLIENVPGAPLLNPLQLCGSSFGLKVRRHRLFESNVFLTGAPCDHRAQGRPVGVYGSKADDIPSGGSTARTLEEGKAAMGIDWDCSWAGLVEAIPPAYTEHLGAQLAALEVAA
jgi:DNA (cytosine-5)-methyltransferase 1